MIKHGGNGYPYPFSACDFFWGVGEFRCHVVRQKCVAHTFFNFQGNFSRVRLYLRASEGVQSYNWFGCR